MNHEMENSLKLASQVEGIGLLWQSLEPEIIS